MDSQSKTARTFYITLVLILLWLVVFGWIAQSEPRIQIALKVIYIVLGTIWIIVRLKTPRDIKIPRVLIPIAGLFLFLTLNLSNAPLLFHAIEIVIDYPFYLLFALFVLDSISRWKDPELWENSLLMLGFLFSLGNLLLVFLWFKRWFSISGSITKLPPFGYRLPGLFLQHPNFEAGFLILLIPLAAVRALRSSSLKHRAAWIGLIGVFLIIEYFSSSRGAWIAGAIGILLTVLLIGLARFGSDVLRFQLVKTRLQNYKVILGLALFGAILLLLSLVFVRQAFQTGHQPLWLARNAPWTFGIRAFLSSPIMGNGPGSVHVLLAKELAYPSTYYLSHTHNLFLQIGAESGLIGLFLVLWTIAWLIIDILRIWGTSSANTRSQLAAIIGSLIALSIHNQVDFLFEAPIYTVATLVLICILYSQCRGIGLLRIPSPGATLLIPILMALTFASSIFDLQSSISLSKDISQYQDDPSPLAVEEICQIPSNPPDNSYRFFLCGQVNADYAERSGDLDYLARAAHFYQFGLDVEPSWAIHWANLAAIEWHLGLNSVALEHMRRAYRITPQYNVIALQLGDMLEKSNQTEEAVKVYQEILSLNSPIRYNQFFTLSDLRTSLVDDYQVEDVVDPADKATARAWDDLNRGFYPEAKKSFLAALDLNPYKSDAYTGLAITAFYEGDGKGAQSWIQMALFTNQNSPWALMFAGHLALSENNLEAAASFFDQAFQNAAYTNVSRTYYSVVYRRPTLATYLVAQLKILMLTPEMIQDLKLLPEIYEELGDAESAARVRGELDLYPSTAFSD